MSGPTRIVVPVQPAAGNGAGGGAVVVGSPPGGNRVPIGGGGVGAPGAAGATAQRGEPLMKPSVYVLM